MFCKTQQVERCVLWIITQGINNVYTFVVLITTAIRAGYFPRAAALQRGRHTDNAAQRV